jgi:hypothetical protein
LKLLPEEGKIKDVFKDDGMHQIVNSSKKRKPKVDAETLRERKRKRNAEYKLRPDVKQRLREKGKERRQKEDVKQKDRERHQTDNAKQRRKEKKKLRRNEEIHDKKANDDIRIDEIRKELISAGINKLHDLPNI